MQNTSNSAGGQSATDTMVRADVEDAAPIVPRGEQPGRPARPDAAGRQRQRVAGQDPAAWCLGGLVVLLSAVFVGASYYYNFGNLVPPLDDVYIHLQYGRQFAEGQFFRYDDDAPFTTGASSLLYMVVLGTAYFVGFTGPWFLAFAVGFGILCFAATVMCVYALGRRLVSRRIGLWAGLLVAVNGALLWGASSGMEIGLVALLLTSSVLAFVREAPAGRFLLTPLIATLAALSRPEGLIFVIALCAAMLWTIGLQVRSEQIALRAGSIRAALCLLPIAAGCAQLLLYQLMTGTTSANGVQAKSYLFAPIFYPTQFLEQTTLNIRDFLSIFTGLNNQDYVFPGALVLFLLGMLYLSVEQPRWRPLALATGIGFAAVLLALSTLVTALWQNVRYAQPFMPLFILLVVIGVCPLARVARQEPSRTLVINGVLLTALLFTLSALPTWGIRLGQQAATIREVPVSIGHWLKSNLPEDAVVAVNDVGAVAYFSEHRTVDLIGLTTNGTAEATANGIGSLYEELRHLPAEQRPDYFSIYERWPGPPVYDLRLAGVLENKPVMSFDLKLPPHQFAPTSPPCQSEGSCSRVSVFKADWSLAGSGDPPRQPPPGELRDYLNVGHLESEEVHAYAARPAQVGIQPVSMLRTVKNPDGTRVADSGRHIIGGEVFTARNLVPGQPLTVQSRVDGGVVAVLANGVPVGTWERDPKPGGWDETAFTVPGELVTGSSVELELASLSPSLSPFPDYHSFGYWFVQQPNGH
ncbi:MAG: hypothetical protein ABR608_05900 [Pseudonocardiaceae bacterium]